MEPRMKQRRTAILLTGHPGVGKTTVIARVVEGLAGRALSGFTTREIRAGGERRGFRLETFDGKSAILAHVSLRSLDRVGRYGVDLAALDAIVEEALDPAAADVYIVDEIGRMECLSEKFVSAAEALLDSGKPVVATVALRGAGFIERVKRRPDVELWQVSRGNRDSLAERILARLEARKG